MKKFKFIIYCLLFITVSCHTPAYVFVDSIQNFGVDFTKGKWLLNELDCPDYMQDALTAETTKSLRKNLSDRLFYINDVGGLLIARKTYLNPSKIKLKELRDGTGYDFFINIVVKKNKDELGSVGFYEKTYPNSSGKNESEAYLEIYDLNLQQIIFSEHVVGSDYEDKSSILDTKKSNRLIDNISFHRSSNKLMLGSLKKILKKLNKTSVTK